MSPNEIVMNYIAAWNERDPAKRRTAVAKAWAHNGHIRFAGGMPDAPLYLGGTDFIRTGPDGLSTAIVGFDAGHVIVADVIASAGCDRPA